MIDREKLEKNFDYDNIKWYKIEIVVDFNAYVKDTEEELAVLYVREQLIKKIT